MTPARCDVLTAIVQAELWCPLRVDAALVPPARQVMARVSPYCQSDDESVIVRGALDVIFWLEAR